MGLKRTLFLGKEDPADQFNGKLPELIVNKNLAPDLTDVPTGSGSAVTGLPTGEGVFSFDLKNGKDTIDQSWRYDA